MVRKPNADRSAVKFMFLALFLALFSNPAKAAEAIHHFAIENPASITAGQEISITITAKLSDDSDAKKTKNRLICSLTGSQLNTSQEINLKNGKATFNAKIDKPMLVIFTVVDKSNSDLMGSSMFKVVPDLTKLNNKGAK